MSYDIRIAQAADMPQVLQRIQDLATYEKEHDAVKITADTLVAYGTGAHPLFTCFLAEKGQDIIGIALVYFRFSTWVGKSLHLEDLIVAQEHRGKGAGQALYDAVMQYAVAQDVNRVEWVVLDWNTPAINFYKRNGATLLTDWHLVQMSKEQLDNYIHNLDNK